MKKNILIIAYAYPPNNVAGAQRPYAAAKYLDKDKYNVSVITCKNPDLPIGKNEAFDPELENVNLYSIKSYLGSSAKVVRNTNTSKKQKTSLVGMIKTFVFQLGQQLIFPDKGMFWYPNVKTFLKNNPDFVNNTDVIISTSPGVTNHKIARFVKHKNKEACWIADFRDFNYVEHWQNKSGVKAFLHKRLEKSIVNDADYFTFVTKTMQKAYQEFYPKHSKQMYAMYNGFDQSDFLTTSDSLVNNQLSFFYAGSFYNGLRSPLPLLSMLDRAINDSLIKPEDVVINIAGNIDDEQKGEMQKYKAYQCINFLGSLPRTEVLNMMSKTTFLWLIVANIKSHYQTIPIKLFEYIAARRPIINFAPEISESSQIIQEKELGYNIDTLHFDEEKSYLIFKKLISSHRDKSFDQPLSADNLISFSWKNQIDILDKIITTNE